MKKIVFLLVLLLSSYAFGTTYYLDAATGNDTNDGSSDSPWKTLGRAEAAVAGGDIVKIRNGTLAGTATTTSYQDTGLAASTSYSYEVYSVDDAGNQSVSAAIGTFSTLADTTPPAIISVTVDSPAHILFSEPLDENSATDVLNYGIEPNITIFSATLEEDLRTVILITSDHSENVEYTLTVNGVKDLAGNLMVGVTHTYQYSSGLIGHWKFDDATGSNAVDSSGNGNTGTLINGPTWTTGKINGALSFDGVDDAVQIGTGNLNVSGRTIAFWAYPESFSSTPQYLFGHATQPWANRIQLYTDDTSGNLDLGLGDSHTRHSNIQDLNTNIWYHITLTWNGTNYAVYTNGIEDANGSYTGLTALNTIADIGNAGNTSDRNEAFNGIIDEVRVYNRALSADEVLDLFNEAGSLVFDPNICDLDGDGKVNLRDFSILAYYWTDYVCSEPNWCEGSDFDQSGMVDFNDLRMLTWNWLWEKLITDLNTDGIVNFGDFTILASYWMDHVCSEPNWCQGSDFDQSGMVDFNDLRIFTDDWLQETYQVLFEDFETGDFNECDWQHSGDANWTVVPDEAYQGNYSARSGSISDDQQGILEITLDSGTDLITFYCKVSSELDYDYLRFYIDGKRKGKWSGEQDWAEQTYSVTAGVHTYTWAYEKDISVSNGSDCAWIDAIDFVPDD